MIENTQLLCSALIGLSLIGFCGCIKPVENSNNLSYGNPQEQKAFFEKHLSASDITQKTPYGIVPIFYANKDLIETLNSLQKEKFNDKEYIDSYKKKRNQVMFWSWLSFFRYLVINELAYESKEAYKILAQQFYMFETDYYLNATMGLYYMYFQKLLQETLPWPYTSNQEVINGVLAYEKQYPFNIKDYKTYPVNENDIKDTFSGEFFYNDKWLAPMSKIASTYSQEQIDKSYERALKKFKTFTETVLQVSKNINESSDADVLEKISMAMSEGGDIYTALDEVFKDPLVGKKDEEEIDEEENTDGSENTFNWQVSVTAPKRYPAEIFFAEYILDEDNDDIRRPIRRQGAVADGWGTPHSGDVVTDKFPAPYGIDLIYYSAVENKFYSLEKKFDVYRIIFAGKNKDKHNVELILGLAPYGLVNLWSVDSNGNRYFLMSDFAKETEVDLADFKNSSPLSYEGNTLEEYRENLLNNFPKVQQYLKEKGVPSKEDIEPISPITFSKLKLNKVLFTTPKSVKSTYDFKNENAELKSIYFYNTYGEGYGISEGDKFKIIPNKIVLNFADGPDSYEANFYISPENATKYQLVLDPLKDYDFIINFAVSDKTMIGELNVIIDGKLVEIPCELTLFKNGEGFGQTANADKVIEEINSLK